MRNTTVLIALASVAVAAAAVPASAQTRFLSTTSFGNASGSTATETFQSAPTGDANGRAMGAFTITTNGTADIRGGTTGYAVDGSRYLDANIYGTSSNPGYLTFTFASAITSFGASFFSLNNDLIRTSAMIDGARMSLPMDPGFVGFVSATPFTTISFVNPSNGIFNDEFGVDNIRYTLAAAPVPEPATWAMLIAGFGMVGFAMRSARRRMAGAAA